MDTGNCIFESICKNLHSDDPDILKIITSGILIAGIAYAAQDISLDALIVKAKLFVLNAQLI